MAWMSRNADRRADVRNVLPGARSVIVTGTIYNHVRLKPDPPDDPGQIQVGTEQLPASGEGYRRGAPPGGASKAVIARYALGDDYHDVLKMRLDALLDWMRAESPEPFAARAYVDTGPVQERVYAQYAGLGWIGKNTCLINAEHGSFLFLSEIITTLPLEPDAQALEQCGSCRRCLDACPTDALVDGGVLDSNKCLSYLTIELRGSIPASLRPAIGNHVYGCDICQDVCPWNERFARALPPESPYAARAALAGKDARTLARELLAMTQQDFISAFTNSPMKRAKLRGLKRNATVVLGNVGTAEDVEVLERAIEDEEPLVREHAQWALARLKHIASK
jgi:epoxyqueuosine reductase